MLLAEAARPRAVREHPWAAWLAVATVCFGAFMGQLDASIVTLTFPSLQRDFHAPLAAVQWVSLSYLLTLVGLVVAAGRLADAAGRKSVYLHGFAVFTAASAACGLAPALSWLVAFRLLQAVGAAMLQANSVALVVTSVPRDRVRAALGVQAAAQALGLAVGPALGGLLAGSAGWQWVFWINVPVGFIALMAGHYLLPRTRDRTVGGRFDFLGLLLLLIATSGLLLSLSGISGLPISPWAAAVAFGLSTVSAVAFRQRARRIANPLVDLTMLRPPAVSGGLVGALCAYLVLFGPLALFPQVLPGASTTTGLVLAALPAGFAAAAVLADRLLPSTQNRGLVGAGVCIGAGAALAVAPTEPLWVVVWLPMLGVGLGVFIPANNANIMTGVPSRMSATVGGLVNMSRGMGTALGVALVTLSLHVAGAAGSLVAARLAIGMLVIFGFVIARTARPPTHLGEPSQPMPVEL